MVERVPAEDDRATHSEVLASFRQAFYGCLTSWGDALFELCDAVLCSLSAVASVPSLSLEPVFRRGHGSLYKALVLGAIDTDRLRRLLVASLPARWPPVFAPYESPQKVTDVWYVPTANGKNGHGAEFAVSLPGRCISLTSKPGDLVLDPFVGSGTTALAAMELGRTCVGFDTSRTYLATAQERVKQLASCEIAQVQPVEEPATRLNGRSTDRCARANGHSEDAEAGGGEPSAAVLEAAPRTTSRIRRPQAP